MTKKIELADLKERETIDILKSSDPTGEGGYYATGYVLPGKEVKTNFFASNNIPLLKIKTLGIERIINVSFSSAANDNEQLLHLLFSKTRKV